MRAAAELPGRKFCLAHEVGAEAGRDVMQIVEHDRPAVVRRVRHREAQANEGRLDSRRVVARAREPVLGEVSVEGVAYAHRRGERMRAAGAAGSMRVLHGGAGTGRRR